MDQATFRRRRRELMQFFRDRDIAPGDACALLTSVAASIHHLNRGGFWRWLGRSWKVYWGARAAEKKAALPQQLQQKLQRKLLKGGKRS